MPVRIVSGDATRVTGVPALVVPANRQLTLGWGSHVAEAVLRLAGPEVEREARERRPHGLALGEAVLTRAGRMEGFTHLVHAAVLDKYDFNPLFLLRLKERTSRATLAKATRAALDCAQAAGLTGLVFTPMGAGIGGMKDAVCAEIMIGEIGRYFAGCPQGPPTDVVIACAQERSAAVFRRRLEIGRSTVDP